MNDPFAGKQIVRSESVEDDKWLRLEFEDGTAAVISGGGYDGLWDDVYITWEGQPQEKQAGC